MKINLVVTDGGFRCASDEDYEKKRTLKKGTVVQCTIREFRNYKFLRKYFSLLNCAWEFLTEPQRVFFKENEEVFRKTVEISAGFFDPVYSVSRKMWLEMPRSIAFDKMTEAEFETLYNRVKDVLFETFIPEESKEEFDYYLKDF